MLLTWDGSGSSPLGGTLKLMIVNGNNMMLWLDDVRKPVKEMTNHDGDVLWVKSYNEFVRWITDHGFPSIISFDHDLADEHYKDLMGQIGTDPIVLGYESYTEKTGYDCAKWLVQYCDDNDLKLPECRVHSANPVGAENIHKFLENAKKHLNI